MIHIRLKEILNERQLTQKELSVMTNIKPATISEIANDQRTTINKKHLETIIDVLEITDISDIIEIVK